MRFMGPLLLLLLIILMLPAPALAAGDVSWNVEPMSGTSATTFSFEVVVENCSVIYVDYIVAILSDGQTNTTVYFEDLQDVNGSVVASCDMTLQKGSYTISLKISVNGTRQMLFDPHASTIDVRNAPGNESFFDRYGCIIFLFIATVVLMGITARKFLGRIKGLKAAPVEELVCSSCGKKVPADSAHCPHCGEPFEGKEYVCPLCGASVGPGDTICGNCGKPLKDIRMAPSAVSVTEVKAQGKKVCPGCGAVVVRKDKVCPGCGKRVRWKEWDELGGGGSGGKGSGGRGSGGKGSGGKGSGSKGSAGVGSEELKGNEYMCARCGAKVYDTDEVCPECGARFL